MNLKSDTAFSRRHRRTRRNRTTGSGKDRYCVFRSDRGKYRRFELFDKTDFTSTEFEQNIRYRRALEGELARLIQKIEFIDSAKVVIAIPEKSVFISEEKNPTASVTTDAEIRSNTPEDISAETRDVNLKYKTEFETYLTGKVLTQLEKIAGRGHVEVRVSADINFDESQIEENTVDPDSSTLVSEESITEASTGSRSIPVGIPGVTSNSPEIQAGSAEVANISDYSKKQKKPIMKTSVSVSVLIDDKLITRNNEQGQPVQEFVKWSDQELAQITAIAQRAVGFNDTRGDKIDVKNISFNQKKEQNQSVLSEQQYMEREFWINIIKYIFFTMVLIALIFVVVRPMVKRLFEVRMISI
ncbi:hypothetical protein CHS0354_035286 [Potamilus streckersoni]|uniref:Flagellar M-ring C-terminal domain-containing protein n=1 Tax=Potamilus streckersoni TaxID=2493646 RepID=A0AAE0VPG4_9BIVA|nr:hypothetical protein CHS0354_035286 [Potamilus streckersoni]